KAPKVPLYEPYTAGEKLPVIQAGSVPKKTSGNFVSEPPKVYAPEKKPVKIPKQKPNLYEPYVPEDKLPVIPTGKSLETTGAFKTKDIQANPERLARQAARLTRKNGGVTVKLNGDMPVSGYVFSPYKNVETVIPKEKFSVKDVDAFIDKHFNLLNQEEHHLGIWIDDGKVYIDVSKVIDDEQRAVEESLHANQIGLFDLQNFETKYLDKYEKNSSGYTYKGEKQRGD
ncbi:MAG: hypothetical protein KW793_03150, partial [Candidatus Doudnabacteria bacterium]|nr:hypothetical protein [Candidatus Doudnabacteria bacterium]